MEKTKLGVSAGLVAAAAYFTALLGGYLVPVLIAGYVLIAEQDAWLKKNAVKAVLLSIGFTLAAAVINLIPDAMGFVDSVFRVFGGSFHLNFIYNVIQVLLNILGLLEKVLFLLLGIQAMSGKTINLPGLDKLLDKYM